MTEAYLWFYGGMYSDETIDISKKRTKPNIIVVSKKKMKSESSEAQTHWLKPKYAKPIAVIPQAEKKGIKPKMKKSRYQTLPTKN